MAAPAPESRFDSLYRAHADSIRSYCLRRLDANEASDAAADVFVVVWRRLDACPEGEKARLWIYGIARNVVANRRRAGARSAALVNRAAAVAPSADPGPEPVVVRRSEYQELDAALEKLPSRYREVLVLAACFQVSVVCAPASVRRVARNFGFTRDLPAATIPSTVSTAGAGKKTGPDRPAGSAPIEEGVGIRWKLSSREPSIATLGRGLSTYLTRVLWRASRTPV
jgi:RNA polymerase sigma factor (sigma-70 family)